MSSSHDLDIDEMERLAAAATPGPWKPDVCYVVGMVPEGRPGGEVIATFRPTVDRLRIVVPSMANAEFTAAARSAVPALVSRVRELEDLLRSTTDRCDAAEDDVEALRTRTECSGREVDLTDSNDACQSARVHFARAERAEAACAQMRARFELLREVTCAAEDARAWAVVDATLNASDAGAGWVSPEQHAAEVAAARAKALEQAARIVGCGASESVCGCEASCRIRALKSR